MNDNKKKLLYVIGIAIVLLIITIVYFKPLPLSGLASDSNQVAMVWNEIGVRDGTAYMDCVEYQSLTSDQNRAILSLLDKYTYQRTLGTIFSDGSMPGYYVLNIYLSNEISMNNYIFVSSSGEILVHGKTYHIKNAEQFIEQILEIVKSTNSNSSNCLSVRGFKAIPIQSKTFAPQDTQLSIRKMITERKTTMDKYIEELRKKAPAQALAMEAREILEAAYGEIAEKVKELADEREVPEDVSEAVAASREYRIKKGKWAFLQAAYDILMDDYEMDYLLDLIADSDADIGNGEEGEDYILSRLEEYEENGEFDH